MAILADMFFFAYLITFFFLAAFFFALSSRFMGRIGADIILRLFWNWARRADAESCEAEFTVVESSGDRDEDKFNAEFEAVVDDDDDDEEAKSLIDDFTNLNFRPWSVKICGIQYVKEIECYCVSMEMLIIWENKIDIHIEIFREPGTKF